MADDSALTIAQRDVLRVFFDLPESTGFVLAGGAALIANGLSQRPTNDIDLFSSDLTSGVAEATDALDDACTKRGWTTEPVKTTATFQRLIVRTETAEILVDLAVDSPPLRAPTVTAFGPTFVPEELAARKLLALYDRAEARDFVDVHALSTRFDLAQIVDMAAELDAGFDLAVLVDMLATLDRFTDHDLAAIGADPNTIRTFTTAWRDNLTAGLS